ncbi:lamin tail domain-containing protein [Candidatus Poribacteria bacterium]|nr:lamin tail domain-containing protein [Candidatus Poribacteria bacterium]
MLSNKMTFSLTSLIILLAIGLAITPALAGEFGAYFTPGELMVDVSSDEGLQINSGRNRAQFTRDNVIVSPDPAGYPREVDPLLEITLSISFDRVVQLGPDVGVDSVKPSQNPLQLSDFTVDAYDDLGRSLGELQLGGYVVTERYQIENSSTYAEVGNVYNGIPAGGQLGVNIDPFAVLAFSTPQAINVADPGELPGQQFRLTIKYGVLKLAYNALTGGQFEIHTLFFTLAKGAVSDASIAAIEKYRKDPKEDNEPDTSAGPKFMRVDLVDDDEGNAQYARITGVNTAVNASVTGSVTPRALNTLPNPFDASDPGVVDISRVDPRSGIAAVATGAFDVRIILTEEPAEFTKDHIMVLNGTASDPVALIPMKMEMGGIYHTSFPGKRYGMANMYDDGGIITDGAIPESDTSTTPFPEPTGRDNKYHLYTVTITPKDNFTGNTTVWVKTFDDKVMPTPNTYGALTQAQILADTLTYSAKRVRDVRALREVLSVPVKTGKTEATTNQEARDTAIKNEPNTIRLPEKFYIPANGYLVLARGKVEHTGIIDSPLEKYSDDDNETFKTDLAAPKQIYNIKHEFSFPYPASNLVDFFRNGGSIELIHQNVAGNTAEAEKKKGYPGANDTAYTAGQVIISEIMWGQDDGLAAADAAKSQWIELHNTTSSVIGIDKNEWVLAFHGPSGGNSALGTVIDTVGNVPGGIANYWSQPGNSGVSVATQQHPTVSDLVSMSRIPETADGTAAASWAMSMIPSANLNGLRIGTPGAANNYVKPAAPPPAPEPVPEPMAPVATASDLMISEIMVASNSGRLPQWIEIKNTAVGEVSLDGWRVSIANDPADADVVASSLSIKLDGVTLDANQVALVVSKTGRNSGVAMRAAGDNNIGDLDSNRIVNAHSMIKPASPTYSMLSEMSFRISLEPPLPLAGGVTDRGDVVGNLGGGWELPMSEAGRSSIIRREMDNTGEIMGTDAAGWQLTSDTSLLGVYVETYYGDKDDVGTPGYDAGGALPVELSKFGAKRDRATGQVIVTWETQSELNNAGFFIKRSQQKDSTFVPVNPTMIPGAGTTSEKQSYTYTDTTAQPNIVYYYQIEDVSLDGQRQTLTRAHRLKGHVGAAGKLTTLWGHLKDQE